MCRFTTFALVLLGLASLVPPAAAQSDHGIVLKRGKVLVLNAANLRQASALKARNECYTRPGDVVRRVGGDDVNDVVSICADKSADDLAYCPDTAVYLVPKSDFGVMAKAYELMRDSMKRETALCDGADRPRLFPRYYRPLPIR